jgi:carbonic anhydrase
MSHQTKNRLTRRKLLRLSATGAAIAAGGAVLVACGGQAPAASSGPATAPAAEPAQRGQAGEAAPIVWKYEEDWSVLGSCGTGKQQSPIELTSTKATDLANIEFHYQSSAVEIENNGHTIEAKYDPPGPDNHITLDGKQYHLAQFHYHAPSEHRDKPNTVYHAMELHLVHRNKDNPTDLAVVGVFVDVGDQAPEHPTLKLVLDHAPKTPQDPKQPIQVDATTLLPAEGSRATYRYSGSLTTPPCTEGVSWLVMVTPLNVATSQVDNGFARFYGDNHRPTQALNGRVPDKDSTP